MTINRTTINACAPQKAVLSGVALETTRLT